MMQTADLRDCDDLSCRRGLNRPTDRCVFGKRKMGTRALVVFEIRFQDSAQTTLTQDDHMIQTLTTDRSDHSFDIGVLPGRLRSCQNFPDIKPPRCPREVLAIASLPQQITRGAVSRKSFQQLVGHPFRCGMLGHREMHNPAAIVRQNHQDEQIEAERSKFPKPIAHCNLI
jgi:hypothetical protein